jgi:hypothetical protein
MERRVCLFFFFSPPLELLTFSLSQRNALRRLVMHLLRPRLQRRPPPQSQGSERGEGDIRLEQDPAPSVPCQVRSLPSLVLPSLLLPSTRSQNPSQPLSPHRNRRREDQGDCRCGYYSNSTSSRDDIASPKKKVKTARSSTADAADISPLSNAEEEKVKTALETVSAVVSRSEDESSKTNDDIYLFSSTAGSPLACLFFCCRFLSRLLPRRYRVIS